MNPSEERPTSEIIELREVDSFPKAYLSQMDQWLLDAHPFLPWREQLSAASTTKLNRLQDNLRSAFKLRLGLFVGSELKGWTFGWQDTAESFYMAASGVAPELRRRGHYSKMVAHVLERTRELGFQSVTSRHILTNNPVIIAKLKLGFTIQGMEVDAVHGTLLRLVHHHNDLMKRATNFRVGATADPEIRRLLLPEVEGQRSIGENESDKSNA